jgi:hypothetical protein
MKNKVNPYPPIGPQTKRESKKSDRQDKIAIRRTPTPMAAPKVNRSIETPESKAAKRKQNIKSVGAAIGVVGATVGGILTDIRYQRGADRVRGLHSNADVPFGQGYRAGKNKKSTKK